MAGGQEDSASVLEQFIHDAANLPAEINYMMEEVQAIDKEMQKHLTSINSKDNTLQKHVKANGSLQSFSKEQEYAEFAKKHYDLCLDMQKKKIVHSEKACTLLDRQLKKLDVKIRELQNDGQLVDGPPLPSIFNRRSETQKPLIDLPTSSLPLQAASISAMNANAVRGNASNTPTIKAPQPRQVSQIATAIQPQQRASAPATPASALHQPNKQEREHSVGADSKRRKLTMSTAGINLPAQPSGLRQSSMGPATPKAGTPTGGSRAGSIPRTLGQQGAGQKKSGVTKKVPHQQVSKLKKKTHARVSQAGRKKGQSPSVRGGRGGTAASEDSVLSSADASDTDASQSRGRRMKKAQKEEKEVEMDEDIDDEEGDEDDRRYCFCNQRSYGEMVACENDDCQYQWFHTTCLKMTKIPDEDEDWYCPECRNKPEIITKINKKQKKK